MNTTPARPMILAKLRSFPMFAELDANSLGALAGLVTYQQIKKGSFLVTQNERGGCMYLLVSGRVKVSLASAHGKEIALSYLDAPSHVGEMSVVDAKPRSADVIAVTDVEVLCLEAKDLAAAIRLQPALALSLIGTLSRRLRQTISRIEDMAFHDATHRVMRVLLNVATAAYESNGVPVISGLTHYEIATLAGTSRETASRVISGLGKEGVLVTKGRRIVIDLLRLRERLAAE